MEDSTILALRCRWQSMAFLERAEGFAGQRIVVLPRSVVAQAEAQPLLGALIPTDVGYFPKASGHARERTEGIDQAIFIYCISGGGWCKAGANELRIGAGELLVIPPRLPHKYGANERRPWTIHWAHAKGRLLPDFLAELGATTAPVVTFVGKDARTVSLLDEVLQIVEQGYAFARLLHAGQALSHLLAVLVRRDREASREVADTEQRIAQSVAHLKRHLEARLDVPGLARLAGLSTSHYTTLFKAHTGYAPIDYLARLRMHRACQLLDSSNHSVKSIAAMVGYQDQMYFSRVFRAINEVSPSEYRNLRKG
jgi:AraC-like DNA-binding protein/mannose-6-phosphate isomerase-like protein (cupin superfamily)